MRSVVAWALLALAFSMPGLTASQDSRVFEFTYQILAGEFPSNKAVDIYIPLPAEHAGQRVVSQTLHSSLPGKRGRDQKFSNNFYHIHRPADVDAPIDVSLSWIVSRQTVRAGEDNQLSARERDTFLAANKLVPVDHPILQPILEEIHQLRTDDSRAATARAIYDWVVDNVEYKKVGRGWGNGDSFWACSERYGNCSDFHALFISLARSERIPARFEIGFPVPEGRNAGVIDGYHCWVQFYLPQQGWVPIDASEAAKHPDKRDLYYGTQPTDRIHFTTGRDLALSKASTSNPLNYFIYPYVEVDGKPRTEKLETRFSYKEIELE